MFQHNVLSSYAFTCALLSSMYLDMGFETLNSNVFELKPQELAVKQQDGVRGTRHLGARLPVEIKKDVWPRAKTRLIK